MFDELYYIVDYHIYKNKKQYSIFFKLKAFFESTKDIFSACMEISTHQEDICHKLKIGQLIAASLFNEYGKIKINYIYSCDVFRSIYDLLKKK